MRRVLKITAWGLAGLAAGGTLAALIAAAAAVVFDISQAEGAYAMGVAFFWVPLGALAGAILGSVIGSRRD